MSDLQDLQELVEAEDPLAWAFANLRLAGQGEAARIFRHPIDPGAVVRISDYPDGWFGYAMALDHVRDDGSDGVVEAVSRHAPRARGMAFIERADTEFYVAVCERLDPIDPESDCRHVGAARAVMATSHPPCLEEDDPGQLAEHARGWAGAAVAAGRLSAEDAASLLAAQPLFLAFAQAMSGNLTDLGEKNWMRRGPHLVLNDPVGTMSPRDEARFKERYISRCASRPGLV